MLDLLFFLGSSLILAVHMSVDSYPDLLFSGAAPGYRMLRVIGVALVYKYCLIEGLSRYTLARGEDIFRGFRTLSIYGTTQAILSEEASINFKNLGSMIAGLLGGTVKLFL